MFSFKIFYEASSQPNIWVVGGPPATGKTTMMKYIKDLKIPDLLIKDLDDITQPVADQLSTNLQQLHDEAGGWDEVAEKDIIRVEQQSSKGMDAAISTWIKDNINKGQDMFLVGNAFLSSKRAPNFFWFPENTKKFFLSRDPEGIIQSKIERDNPKQTNDAFKVHSTDDASMQGAIDEIKQAINLYKQAGWTEVDVEGHKVPQEIIDDVKNTYQYK